MSANGTAPLIFNLAQAQQQFCPADLIESYASKLSLVRLTPEGAMKLVRNEIHNAALRTEERKPRPYWTIYVRVLDYTRTLKGKTPRSVDIACRWEDVEIALRNGTEIHFAVRA